MLNFLEIMVIESLYQDIVLILEVWKSKKHSAISISGSNAQYQRMAHMASKMIHL